MRKKQQPITNQERLARELREARRERGVRQHDLAERALVSRRTLTNAENAANVGIRELTRLANALGYDVVLRRRQTVVFEELADFFKDDA